MRKLPISNLKFRELELGKKSWKKFSRALLAQFRFEELEIRETHIKVLEQKMTFHAQCTSLASKISTFGISFEKYFVLFLSIPKV